MMKNVERKITPRLFFLKKKNLHHFLIAVIEQYRAMFPIPIKTSRADNANRYFISSEDFSFPLFRIFIHSFLKKTGDHTRKVKKRLRRICGYKFFI